MWGPLGANGTPLGTIKPLELSGAPDQELMEQRAGGHSRSRAFGPPEQVGPLKKNRAKGTTVETMGHGAPGAGWDPRSRANGARWSKQGFQIKR